MKLPFKDSPIPKLDDPFFNKYPIPKLDTDNEEILFRPAWNLNMNGHFLDPRVCSEMLDHLVLPRDRVFGAQVSSEELMMYFLEALMQVALVSLSYCYCVVVFVVFFF